ncbi:MAG: DUF3015 domain-containing protein [Planctomycetota bacterium]|nr:MAG: DUF3015 domain-containing protein [Planctomycetota bacterium]
MRFILAIIVAAATIAAVQAADHNNPSQLQRNVGIGLGTLIFDGNDGLFSQVAAATTNATSGNQTFAITSGTLGAERPDSIVKNERVRDFLHDNMDMVARDIAAGGGEGVDVLAELLEVPEGERVYFARKLQANFSRIFPSAEVDHEMVLHNLAEVIEQA